MIAHVYTHIYIHEFRCETGAQLDDHATQSIKREFARCG